MIKKVFLTAVLLLTAHSLFVSPTIPKWWWQDNFTKAQNFIYNDTKPINNLIIGTSFSNRLIIDKIPNTQNLSFEGQGVFDQLRILQTHPNKLPKNIFIEMNLILRTENKEFIKSLNSPILFYPKKWITGLRENKQPIDILGKILLKITTDLELILTNKNKTYKPKKTINNLLFNEMLTVEYEKKSKLPKKEDLNSAFNLLKTHITFLENNGVKVMFYEMPINYILQDLPNPRIVRTTFYKNFPQNKYHYILLPKTKYKTTDGLHLGREEATEYTQYFIKNGGVF